MTALKLIASHAHNVRVLLINELAEHKCTVVESECSRTKTVFSIEAEEDPGRLLQLRNLRYADEVYLEIYHNRMSPSEDHPNCPIEMRGYISLLFYSINYVPEIARCLQILCGISKHLEKLTDEEITINIVLLTSERSEVWINGLEIVRQDLQRHISYAMRATGHRWKIRCRENMFKEEDGITVVIFADRYDIYAGVLLFDEEDFRPHMTFWQLSGAVAAMAVELADIHDGDIVLDMACDCGELTLEVLRNYDCFCIAMSPKIDQLAMAEVNWVGLQNHLKKESGNRARHLQFIAVEFNKDFFNFNVVSKILCSLPLRWWKVKGDLLDTFYDKVFTIISKCRQETYSVLLIPLLKDHKRRVKEASASDKYNFLVLKMRRIMTRSTHLYVCLLETKLPNLAFPERNHVVDLLVAQDTLLSQPLDLALSPNPLFHQRRPLNLPPPVANHFVQNNLCMPMLPSSSSLNSSIQSPIDFPITRSPLDLPPLSTDRMIGSNMFFLDGDH